MKTASFEEQIVSKDKAILRAIVFIIFHIYSATGRIWKLGSITQIFHSFSWGIFHRMTFGPIACKQRIFTDIYNRSYSWELIIPI